MSVHQSVIVNHLFWLLSHTYSDWLCFLQESASLADRLIQYQVTRAQEAEEMFILKNELASTKQLLRDNDYKLQQAKDQIQNFDLQVCHIRCLSQNFDVLFLYQHVAKITGSVTKLFNEHSLSPWQKTPQSSLWCFTCGFKVRQWAKHLAIEGSCWY